MSETLAALGFETHLWFISDPDLSGHEIRGRLHLHRWAQWVNEHHPGGVFDGEFGKESEFAASLPLYLLREVLLPCVRGGGRAVIHRLWEVALVDGIAHPLEKRLIGRTAPYLDISGEAVWG